MPLSTLTSKERELYEMYCEAALTEDELAERCHVTKRSARTILYTARVKMGHTSGPKMLLAYWKEKVRLIRLNKAI